jgi:hypothetical protein
MPHMRSAAARVGRLVAAAAVATLLVLAALPAAAAARDSDGDGMPNRWEKAHGLDPFRANARGNPDRDGLRNLAEFTASTDPQDADTDDDGLTDGAEVNDFETDPADADTDDDGLEDGVDDSDDDGIADGQEDGETDDEVVGTIASFDAGTGLLTVDTTLGTQVSGTVTAATELEWSDCDGVEATSDDLVAGAAVDEMEYVDGTTDLEGVALVPATACGEDDQGED